MLALSLGVAAAVLVNSVVNIALPTLSVALDVSASSAVWIVNAYQLAVAVALLPCAAWGERIGHLRVYQLGLATFMLASAACAIAPTFATLLLARVLQGLGAAGVMAVNTALLRVAYPKAQLGRGVGINGMVVAVYAASGPTLGGSVLAQASWPWLFVPFVVLAALAIGLGWGSLVEPQRRALPSRFDVAGVVLQAGAIASLVLGVSSLSRADFTAGAVGLVAVSFVLAVWFVRRESRLGSPLLPLDLLRQPPFARSFGASCASFVAQMLALVALPFSLHQMGFGPERTGLLMTPWPLAVMVIAPIAGALSDRWSARLLGGIGLGLASLAMALLATLPTSDASAEAVIWRVALCGVGFALFSAPNVRTLVAAAPVQRSGAVGATIAISRQLGQTLGAALASVMLGLPGVDAGPPCFAVAAVVTLIAAAVTLLYQRAQP